MTTLRNWQPNDDGTGFGLATFTIGDKMLQVRLESLSAARAIDDMVDLMVLRARRKERVMVANQIRDLAHQVEHGV